MKISEEARQHALAIWYYAVMPFLLCLLVAYFAFAIRPN